jgi:ketosteroid isomerase-like protein
MTSVETQTETTRALLTRMYDSAARGDFADVLACLADDLVVHEPPYLPYGGIYDGVEAFQGLIGLVVQHLDVSKMVVDRMVADGDRVIGIIRMPAVATGEDILLAEESLVRDGKVAEIWVYYNETQGLHRGR